MRSTTLVALAALVLLAGCGEKEDRAGGPARTDLTLVLDYFPNADHAPLYAAQAAGRFEKAGLDVTFQEPADPSAPLKLLQAGQADLAISYEPELLLANDKGADLVAVAALVQEPLTSIVSIGDRAITRPEELRGKTVGTSGIPYQAAYLKTILQRAGVDPSTVREVDLNDDLVGPLLARKVDAVLGAFWNVEALDLARRKRDPKVIRMEKVGVPSYDELIIVARKQDVGEDGPRIRRFVQAMVDGANDLRRDPEPAIRAISRDNRDIDAASTRASVKATMEVFFPKDPDKPFGYLDLGEWARYTRWMVDNELISREPPIRPFTNEFLPGEGVVAADETP